MQIDRRSIVKMAAMAPLASAMPGDAWAAGDSKADHMLRIATSLVELAPDHIVSTRLYNDQLPGPMLHMQEGHRITVATYDAARLLRAKACGFPFLSHPCRRRAGSSARARSTSSLGTRQLRLY